MRFSETLIREILKMKPVGFKREIYSPEYQRYFKTEHSIAEIKPHSKELDKYHLTIDGSKRYKLVQAKIEGISGINGNKA